MEHGWRLTVAAVIEREGRFLVVEETDGVRPDLVFNQPAGHVDPHEGIVEAVIRETMEETGLAFTPTGLLGIWPLLAANGRDYCRIAFAGTVPEGVEAKPQDPEILACHWFTREELTRLNLRSPLVLQCIDAHLAGRSLPLDLLHGVQTER